jgi:phenylacetic acid degradation protein paaN
MTGFFEAHRGLLEAAVAAARTRGYWSAYPEVPSGKIYGETAKADGEAAFKALIGKPFPLDQRAEAHVGAEASPYGFDLAITYPSVSPAALVVASENARPSWARASVEDRTGVALEILARLNRQSFLIANAVQHTSGQAFIMAFQAGGPHAQDRGLEAVAYAYDEMARIPAAVTWTKPAGKVNLVLDKSFRIVPRGTALVIGCATFPTWNSYPGLFASLVTGNSVIVKPHPGAILPLAITVRIAREVLREAGFDENVVQLAPDTADRPITKDLVLDPAVRIIDFTGSPAFGEWVRENARDKQVYTEEAGVNSIVIDSTDDFRGLAGNIAFSLSLYTGQMCTAPQNIYVPRDGIDTAEGHLSFDQVAEAIADGVRKLLGDPARAVEVLGAVQNEGVLRRLEAARSLGSVVLDTQSIIHPAFPDATVRTPLIVKLTTADRATYLNEWFGPIAFIIGTADTGESLAIARDAVRGHGALTLSVYSTRDDVIARAIDVAEDAGVALSINLTGGVFVNQSAAFSDFHGTGANPAANASLTDAAYVASRFRVVQHRMHV